MGAKRTTFTEMIIKGIMLFAVFTVLQNVAFFGGINKIWVAALSLALVARLLTYRYTVSQFFALLLMIFLHIIALYFTEYPMVNLNMLFYFALWVMLYVFVSKSKRQIVSILRHSDFFITGVLWIWTLIVGVAALLPSNYDGRYFTPFGADSFRFIPTILIVSALAMYMAVSRNDKKYEMFLIIPTVAVFMNQSRTYFGVFIIFLVMYMYMRVKSKKYFYMLLGPMIALVLGLMTVSGIMDKIIATSYTENSYFDFWGTITSGRTVFWKWDLDAFFALPFWQQFVGNGFNFVYDVNAANMNAIWAHNDVINLLMNFGYLGVILYFWAYFMMIKTFWPKGNIVPFPVKAMFHGGVFINSMMNMSYTYLCAMISYPLFLCVIAERYDNKLVGKQPV